MNELNPIENLPPESKKSRRGGKRPGAGRPKKTPEERLAATGTRKARKPVEEQLPSEELGNFIIRVIQERDTFPSRVVPGQSVARHFDGSAFDWPIGHPLTIARDYAQGAVSGSVVVGLLVKQAAHRFLNDLETCAARHLYLDPEAAENIFTWFTEFNVPDFKLQPWQVFMLVQIFAWKQFNGLRRFREVWFEIGKKNGKTCLMASIALFMLLADAEPLPEVYTAANSRDQARLCFRMAKHILEECPHLKYATKVLHNSIMGLFSGSFYHPLSSDAKSVDGPNVHAALFDEVHEFVSDELYTKLTLGRRARTQPLIICSTTAGNRLESFAGTRHEYFTGLLMNVFNDDTKLAFIYALDANDDWKDEKNWVKANPNLGVTVQTQTLREEVAEIENYPSNLTGFLRYACNLWLTPQESCSLPPERVAACTGLKNILPPWKLREWFMEKYVGQRCFGGFDYGETDDMCCFTLIFPDVVLEEGGEEKLVSVPWYFIPEDHVARKEKLWRVPLQQWVREGWIHTLPGNITDPGLIRPYLAKLLEDFRPRDTGFDRWGGITTMMATLTQEQYSKTTEVPQHMGFITNPAKVFKLAVLNGTFAHLNNPVLMWNMLNVSLEIDDRTSGMLPRKAGGNRNKKIDGVQATITAMQRALDKEANPQSIYIDRGITTI